MHRSSSYDLSLGRNIDYLTSLVPSGHPYQSIPTEFQLPEYYKDNPYGRPLPSVTNPDPFNDNLPFVDDSKLRLISQPNGLSGKSRYADKRLKDSFTSSSPYVQVVPEDMQMINYNSDVATAERPQQSGYREYYPSSRPMWFAQHGQPVHYRYQTLPREASLARDLIQNKDKTIFLLTALAVIEGIVILSLARRERRGVI